MKRLITIFLLFCGACSSSALETLHSRSEQIRSDVYWIADDARAGRFPGTPGADETADFIESRFRALHLSPLPQVGGYQQYFSIIRSRSIESSTRLDRAVLTEDFSPISTSINGAFNGKVAFVGYGVQSDAHHYDDYANIDVKGRVVIALRYEPHDANGKSRFTHGDFSPAASINAKADLAAKHGAVALLLVNAPIHHPKDGSLRAFHPDVDTIDLTPIPVISISRLHAKSLLGDLDLMSVQQSIDETGKPQSQLLDTQTNGQVSLKNSSIKTSNIIATIPGIGANRDEYIIVGGHYDHLGSGKISAHKSGSEGIHNGADDNASGIAAMLDIARELAHHRFNRTILFAAFSAEESGCLGSRQFVQSLKIPPDKIRAMINLDMVGRVRKNTLFIGGTGTDPRFHSLLTESNQSPSLNLKSIGQGGLGPSDHQSFAMQKIPVLFLFSGMHGEYHHPDDDPSRINFRGIQQVSDLVCKLIEKLSTDPRKPYVDTFDNQPMNVEIDPDQPATKPIQK